MGIVAYYARMSQDQLAICTREPQRLISGSVADLPGAEVIDVDRSWEPMAWLVSPCKRIEQEYDALVTKNLMAEMPPKKPSWSVRIASLLRKTSDQGPPVRSAALQESLRRIDEAQLDLPLVAIEGRTQQREEAFNFGLGGAAIFPPEQVAVLSKALSEVTPKAIEQQYKPELMDRLGVFPQYWVEEGRDLMDNYVLPNLKTLQSFYSSATQSGQTVLMWFM